MSNALVSYQFEETPVRVVMIAGDPWFVATDLSQALGYTRAPDMVRNLDDDEKGVHIVHTLGGEQDLTIISESGMYSAVFKSRKAEAQRFRKWVTGEVLPELRRTGKYEMHDFDPPPQIAMDLDPSRLMAGVAVVRLAKGLYGPQAARDLWSQVGLPAVIADTDRVFPGDPLADPLKVWLEGRAETTISEAAEGVGLTLVDHSTRQRIGQLLRMWGWTQQTRKVDGKAVRVFSRPLRMIEGAVA